MKKGFFFKEKKTLRGFTLIELLVVISIIGILASLTLVSYSGAQKQTRDTQRRSDLAQYRNGLANFASSNDGLYPCVNSAQEIQDDVGVCSDLKPDFISACPLEPLEDVAYSYNYITDSCGTASPGDPVATEYILWANLETTTFWLVCSTGESGVYDSEPGSSTCPDLE